MAVNNELNLGNTPLSVAKGGQGNATLTAYTPLCGGTTSTGAVQSVASLGTNAYPLASQGAGALPQFSSSDWQVLEFVQQNNVASVNFDNIGNFFVYMILLDYANPATDGVNLIFRTSTDNGSTFTSAAASYAYRQSILTTALTNAASASATAINLTANTGNTAVSEFCYGRIMIFNPTDSSTYTNIVANMVNFNSSGGYENVIASGYRLAAEDNDAFQILFNSGNLASVNCTLYGMVNS